MLRKPSRARLLPAFLVLALCAHAPAWGDEAVPGTKEALSTRPVSTPGKTERLDGEVAAAREGVRADPSQASAHVRLAELLVRKGALDEAMVSYDEALKLNPRSHDARTGRGVVLARKGNLTEAAQALREALRLNPNPVRTHYELGLVYEKLGDPVKAVAEFKEGIRKHEQGR